VVAVGASKTGAILTEDSPFTLDHVNIAYVHVKRATEQLVLDAAASGQDVVITNPGYLAGPDDYEKSVLGKFCKRFWKGRILAAPGGGVSFADVRDVAVGHLLAAQHGRAGRRYILSGENRDMQSFMAMLACTAGYSPRVLPRATISAMTMLAVLGACRACLTGKEPYPSFQQLALSRFYWYYDAARARRELGFQTRPLADTVADTFRWYGDRCGSSLRPFNRWWMRPRTIHATTDRAAA
jgi:dihydroflavonol-4-reductase